jgi:hypothetical protein
MDYGFVEHHNSKTFGSGNDHIRATAHVGRDKMAPPAARPKAVRRWLSRSSGFTARTTCVTLLMGSAAVGLTAAPAAAAVAVTGWQGRVSTSLVEDTGGDHGFTFSATWTLDGVLAQDTDPFLFPDSASFVHRAPWTAEVNERNVDTCDTNGDGVLERYPWSRQGTGSGVGTVTIQYGDAGNPNAYRVSPVPDGDQLTATMPAAATPCTSHPGGPVGTRSVGAPIAAHAVPLDSSGYLHIAGSDTEGTESISWDLFRFPPAFAFSRATYSVLENQATATITVARGGDPRIPASVRYAAVAGTATAVDDFTATSGVLRFAVGETAKSFAVAIVPDAVAEGPETISLRLSAPSTNATLVTPRTARLTIGASDQQPDALISTSAATGFVGDNIYNSTGAGQTATLNALRGQVRNFFVRVVNDGNETNTIAIRGSAAAAGSTVAYFAGSTDVTATMRSATGLRVTLAPAAARLIRVRIVALPDAVVGSSKPARVTGTWVGDGPHVDAARAVLKVTG